MAPSLVSQALDKAEDSNRFFTEIENLVDLGQLEDALSHCSRWCQETQRPEAWILSAELMRRVGTVKEADEHDAVAEKLLFGLSPRARDAFREDTLLNFGFAASPRLEDQHVVVLAVDRMADKLPKGTLGTPMSVVDAGAQFQVDFAEDKVLERPWGLFMIPRNELRALRPIDIAREEERRAQATALPPEPVVGAPIPKVRDLRR